MGIEQNKRMKFFSPAIIGGVIIMVAGVMLRLKGIGASLWTDEFATYWVSSAGTWAEVIKRAEETQGMSPFYFLLIRLVLLWFPHNAFFLRLISLSASVLSIFLIFMLCKLIFDKQQFLLSSNISKSHNNTYPDMSNKIALTSAIMFAIDPVQIFYASDARPYALALLFIILSQFFFVKLLIFSVSGSFSSLCLNGKKSFFYTTAAYIISSSLMCYIHYFAGLVVAAQGSFIILLFLYPPGRVKSEKTGYRFLFMTWIISGLAILGFLLLLFHRHLKMLFLNRSEWNWLILPDIQGTLSEIIAIFNLKIYIFPLLICIILILSYRMFISDNIRKRFTGIANTIQTQIFIEYIPSLIFLLLWFSAPVILLVILSYILRVSFISARYMLVSYPAIYILTAYCLCLISSVIKSILDMKNCPLKLQKFVEAVIFTLFFVIFIKFLILPCWIEQHNFCIKIPHDWEKALNYLQQNIKKGDAILIRSGFIKENWLPYTKNPIIHEYVKSPLFSFYINKSAFSGIVKRPKSLTANIQPNNANYYTALTGIPIFSLTYTYDEKKFHNYYANLCRSLKNFKRVWIIGINPPNTNYSISTVPSLLKKYASKTKKTENIFSGVYIALCK